MVGLDQFVLTWPRIRHSFYCIEIHPMTPHPKKKKKSVIPTFSRLKQEGSPSYTGFKGNWDLWSSL